MKKYIKISTLSIVIISIMAMFFSCSNDMQVVNSLRIEDEAPISTLYDSESIITDSGKVRVIIKSPQIDHYISSDEYLEMPKGINVTFFDSIGQVSSTIKSNYAISNQNTLIVEAKHNVIATNSEGKKLYTEKLIWDQKKHLIYTDEKVKVVTENKIMFGEGLEADEEFNDWEITNISGDIILPNSNDSIE